MTFTAGLLNVVLGLAYTTYGLITIVDLKRGWKTMGFSHFGAAWIAMAFTCGPHHLVHGTHLLFEGRMAGPLDLVAVAVGLPAGVVFLSLRAEATLGGRGDRFISGSPLWLRSLPTLAATYITILVVAVLRMSTYGLPDKVTPNIALIVLYFMIGYFLLRTQLRNRGVTQGWSASGVALTVVFPTCGLMHGVFALYAATGLYHDVDWHGLTIDWLAVPAAVYFLWVVRSLYRRSIRDWNRKMFDTVADTRAVVVTV
ncbi:MAG: hypothetical protein WD646_10150 [Actinomycetota bacterium]